MKPINIRDILIHTIRLLPLLCATAILFGAIETLWSIYVGDFTKYNYDDGTSYLIYNTPISDYLSAYFSSTYAMIFVIWLLSKVFHFCAYHRVFIWFMLGNRVMDEVCKHVTWSVDAPIISYTVMSAWAICLFISLWLHQKYGDREIN